MDQNKIGRKISSNLRLGLVIIFIAFMFFAVGKMALSGSEIVSNGKADLTGTVLGSNKTVPLNGQWEFYWNQLLTPADFAAKKPPQMDSLMKVQILGLIKKTD